MLKAGQTSAILPVRSQDGPWVLDPKAEADLFADVMGKKYVLPGAVNNEFSDIPYHSHTSQSGFSPIRKRHVEKVLKLLDEDSSSGPDKLPTKLLKRCSGALALPIAILCRPILSQGVWPESWRIHWLFPLFKKKSRSDPSNYSGIHLTYQLPKIVERVLSTHLLPYLTKVEAFVRNQFAYIRQRGYRDALAFVAFKWVWALGHGQRVQCTARMLLAHLTE